MSVLNPWTLDHCESPDIWSHSRWRWHNSRTRGTKDLRSRTASSVSGALRKPPRAARSGRPARLESADEAVSQTRSGDEDAARAWEAVGLARPAATGVA